MPAAVAGGGAAPAFFLRSPSRLTHRCRLSMAFLCSLLRRGQNCSRVWLVDMMRTVPAGINLCFWKRSLCNVCPGSLKNYDPTKKTACVGQYWSSCPSACLHFTQLSFSKSNQFLASSGVCSARQAWRKEYRNPWGEKDFVGKTH